MTTVKTPAQLAHQIWPRLVVVAEAHGIITRKTLAKRFGITGKLLRDFDQILASIESYCRRHGLPPLAVLIVLKDSDIPGQGSDTAASDAEHVYAYDWRHRSPIIPSADDFSAVVG